MLMTAREMSNVIDRDAFIDGKDGLVPCRVIDAVTAYGSTRLVCEVRHRRPNHTHSLSTSVATHLVRVNVEAWRVLFPTDAADVLTTTPSKEI